MSTYVPPLPQLTPAQWRTLGMIASYIESRQRAPTYREIAWMCGFASASVALYQVRRLEAAGMLAREKGTARSIRIVKR